MPDPPAFDAGSRYDLRSVLGRGGMGVVYEARDAERDETVALKAVGSVDSAAIRRLKNEFRLVADVQHANLVSLYELREHAGNFFFTMELVPGASLAVHVRGDLLEDSPTDLDADTDVVSATETQQGVDVADRMHSTPRNSAAEGFDELRLRDAMRQLARALHALHQRDLVHRDVKPSNVRVTPQGRVVLLDFGIAFDASQGTQAEKTGTLMYMAPEQLQGASVSPAADMYAFGAVLYELLTGRPPFVGPQLEVLGNKVSRDPDPPSAHVGEVPEDLEKLTLQLLDREPALRPTAIEILERLSERSVERPRSDVVSGSTAFVGRERELSALRHALETASQGEQVTVAVRGPAGIGKTALLQRFVDTSARSAGTATHRGRCHEREAISFRGVEGIVDSIVRRVNRRYDGVERRPLPDDVAADILFPAITELRPTPQPAVVEIEISDPAELRARAFASLRRWLHVLCAKRLTVFVLDDAQDLDEDGLSLLSALLSGPEAPPVLLLASVETAEEGEEAAVPLTLPGTLRELVLGSLPTDEAQQLFRSLSGVTLEKVTETASTRAGGNPAEIVERAMSARSVVERMSGAAPIEEIVEERTRGLGVDARRWLEALAISIAPIPFPVLATLGGGDAEATLAQLVAAHLVIVGPGPRVRTIEPAGTIIRDAVLSDLEAAARAQLELGLAKAYRSHPQLCDPGTLAIHLERGGDIAGAAKAALAAAQHAARSLAFGRASEMYRMARRCSADDPLGIVSERLGEALAASGRGAEAAGAYLEAAARADPDRAHDLERVAAEQLLRAGFYDEGLPLLRKLLKQVGTDLPETPLRALGALLLRRGQLAMRGLDFEARSEGEVGPATLRRIDTYHTAAVGLLNLDIVRGAHMQTILLLEALAAGEPRRVLRGLVFEAPIAASTGRLGVASSVRAAKRALTLGAMLGDAEADALAITARGFAALQRGRFRDALPDLEAGARQLRDHCVNVWWELATARTSALWCLAGVGDLDELGRRLPVLLRSANARNDRFTATNLVLGLTVLPALAEDEPERAREDQRRGMEPWTTGEVQIQHAFHLLGEALIDLYEGEADRGVVRLDAALPGLRKAQILRNQLLRVFLEDVRGRMAVRSGDLKVARSVARALRREGVAWAAALADALSAGIARSSGDERAARLGYAKAKREFEDAGMAMHAAAMNAAIERNTNAAEPWLSSQRVVSPARFLSMLAPH